MTAESCFRAANPETSDDVCRLADNDVAAHQSEMKPEHILREPREEKKEASGRWNLGGKRDLKNIDCFNCHQKGHYSFKCPSKALFCGVKRAGKWNPGVKRGGKGKPTQTGVKSGGKWNPTQPGVTSGGKWNPIQTGVKRAGAVEGNSVKNIPLDTAQVEVAGGQSLEVTAAVSETLPMDVLLETDVPEFDMLLGQNIVKHAEATAVTTCAQEKMRAEQEQDLQERDLRAGASVTGIAEPSLVGPEWMGTFDDELFEGGRVRVRLSRSQKRASRWRHWEPTPEEVEAEHSPLEITPHAVDITAGQLRVLQEADACLDAARNVARDCPYSTGVGSDGLLGQQWTAGGLELEGVLAPLNDHIGKFKYISTMDLVRGYWQALVAPKDREKIAFTTPYELMVPFYLKDAFQRLTNSIAHGLDEISESYTDDMVVTWVQQLEHLMRLRACKAGSQGQEMQVQGDTMCLLGSGESTNISVCCWIRGEECGGLLYMC